MIIFPGHLLKFIAVKTSVHSIPQMNQLCNYQNRITAPLPMPHYIREREGGQYAVYYTGLQSFIITFSYLLALQLWRF